MLSRNRFLTGACLFPTLFLRHFHLKSMAKLALIAILAILASCKAGTGEGLDENDQALTDEVDTSQFAAVQDIFTGNCIACHFGTGAPAGLLLTPGNSYANLVDVPSSQQGSLLRVNPGDAEASYLVRKIRGDDSITGTQMPQNRSPLSDADITTIIDWINSGAPNSPTDPKPDPNEEFIAELSDFSNYKNWEAIDYSMGPTNAGLGSAHKGDMSNFSRRVFINDIAQQKTGEEYPNGSILVKEVVTYENGSKEFASMGGLLAMVKRGADFNSDYQGWEWFDISPDLSSIQAQGASLMDNGCNLCHQQANTQAGGGDYVFAHPSEHIAESSDFTGYDQWALIDDRNDVNALLGEQAHGADKDNTVRRVYKKQLYANPDTEAQGYPIGTTIVKEVSQDDEVIEVTAMVKRGGSFNSANNSWEWFMLDPETAEILVDEGENPARGADLMDDGCNKCHIAANLQSGEGRDYVFKHEDDPFNNNEEFVASIEDFANYTSWQAVDYSIGATNASIGGGHQGLDDNFSRRVYMNDTASEFEGTTYPKGSIFIKEITSWQNGSREFSDQLGLVAMVKRGANFNTEHNGWEWFDLKTDGTEILERGANYRNDGCNNCHSLAEDQEGGADYVFPHPSEFIAKEEDFSDYTDWELVDERTGKNPLLGDVAHEGGDENATRKVYKKQLYASPEDEAFGFPIGTIFVKEIIQADQITGLVAMAKRGGNYNNDHKNWEWFVLDPADASIMELEGGSLGRGGNLMDGGCNTCHAAAKTGDGEGNDYVFFHPLDPQNSN